MSVLVPKSYMLPSSLTLKSHSRTSRLRLITAFPNHLIFTKTYSSQVLISNCTNKVSSPKIPDKDTPILVPAPHTLKVGPQPSGYPPTKVLFDKMPEHVAIILDGSRRWLKAHGKPITYAPFFQANLLFADLCIKWGVGTATSFVYSLKNLERGEEANDMLFGQLETFLEDNRENFTGKGIRVSIIGERSVVPESLQGIISQVEEATKECTKLELMLAVCYSGTRDIVEATRNICEKVKMGVIEPNNVDEVLLEQELWTKHSRAPHVDLLIRTGGRIRISDYLIWQLAQTELYFTDTSAPEFGEDVFVDALRSFQLRERTLGK